VFDLWVSLFSLFFCFFLLLSNNSNLCSILHLLALGMVALYVFDEIPLRRVVVNQYVSNIQCVFCFLSLI
jgi:hypothetical protein